MKMLNSSSNIFLYLLISFNYCSEKEVLTKIFFNFSKTSIFCKVNGLIFNFSPTNWRCKKKIAFKISFESPSSISTIESWNSISILLSGLFLNKSYIVSFITTVQSTDGRCYNGLLSYGISIFSSKKSFNFP